MNENKVMVIGSPAFMCWMSFSSTRIPKARPRSATREPTLPHPMTPRVLPSRDVDCFSAACRRAAVM